MEPGVIAKTEAPNAPKEEILDYAVEFDKENSIVQRFVLLNCLYRAIYTVCSLMGDGGVGISNNKVMSRTRGEKKKSSRKRNVQNISPYLSLFPGIHSSEASRCYFLAAWHYARISLILFFSVILVSRLLPVWPIVIIAENLLVAFSRKGVVQLTAAALTSSRGASHGLQLILVFDHFEFVVVTRVVADTSAALHVEVDSKTNAEDDDGSNGRVDPRLGVLRGTKGGEERGQEAFGHGCAAR